jgi:uncharacterized protein (TIGR02246 family)
MDPVVPSVACVAAIGHAQRDGLAGSDGRCGVALECKPAEIYSIRRWNIMKRRFLFAAALCSAMCFAVAAPKTSASDEQALRSLVQRIIDGWSAANGSMIASVYAGDGTLVAGDGTVTTGPDHIARYHDRQFEQFLKGTRLTVQVRSIHWLGEGIALMQTEGGILWPSEQQMPPGRRGIQSFVAVRENGTWRVRLFQNTRIVNRP